MAFYSYAVEGKHRMGAACDLVVDVSPEGLRIDALRRVYDRLSPYLRSVPVGDIDDFIAEPDAAAEAAGISAAARNTTDWRFVTTGARVEDCRVKKTGVLVMWLPTRGDLKPPTFWQFMEAYYPCDHRLLLS